MDKALARKFRPRRQSAWRHNAKKCTFGQRRYREPANRLKKIAVSSSTVPKSSGDEGGTLKGMVSATNMDKMKFKSDSSKVVFQGAGSSTGSSLKEPEQTSASTPAGTQVKPSQTKVRIEDD